MSDQTDAFVLPTLLGQYLRLPSNATRDANGVITYTFTPPLTVAEQATFADLKLLASFGISANITPDEFAAIKPDLATAKNFLGIASPTAAQSNAALKATIRVLGALLRA